MAPGTAFHSCLYFGQVTHKRLQPFLHGFAYRVFSLYLDLDELPRLSKTSRIFSHNRWNLLSFHDRDHGPRSGAPLRPWLMRHLQAAGINLAGGPIRLLCFPRVLGYVFNPLSIWFCFHADGDLKAVLYEVRNTFGEKHGYLIPVDAPKAAGDKIEQSCSKRFYVSPFMDMDADYGFRLCAPGNHLSLVIRQWQGARETFIATQTGRRADWSEGALLRSLLAYPLCTLKVMAAIHWQALKLWRKGATLRKRPAAPAQEVTLAAHDHRTAAE